MFTTFCGTTSFYMRVAQPPPILVAMFVTGHGSEALFLISLAPLSSLPYRLWKPLMFQNNCGGSFKNRRLFLHPSTIKNIHFRTLKIKKRMSSNVGWISTQVQELGQRLDERLRHTQHRFEDRRGVFQESGETFTMFLDSQSSIAPWKRRFQTFSFTKEGQ